MTSTATPNAISSPAGASGPSQLDLLDGLTTDHSGPAPVRASRSRLPAKGSEPMIQGICGRTFIASSVPDGPLSSWESRLRERLATVGSTESALIWKAKDTPAGRLISRLAVSTRHTNATGSTGSQWSTPRASDGEKGGPNQSFGAGGQPLPAHSQEYVDKHKANGHGMANLNDHLALTAIAYMPTPTVADVQGGRKARSGKRSGEPLLNGICYGTEPTGPTPNGSSATTARRGAPNPVFAFWLMGFPAEWISGALAAMQSYPRRQRKSSRPSST